MAEAAKAEPTPGSMIARKEGGIGWMIYDQQAKYNAVTYDMRRAIPGIMADFEADDEIRVVVIAGAGDKAFISGSDISQFGEKRSSEEARKMYDEASEQANASMASFSKPMIAMIHGYCLGAGVLTAMLCERGPLLLIKPPVVLAAWIMQSLACWSSFCISIMVVA